MHATPIPVLCSMDVAAILVTYSANGEGRTVVLCSAYLLYDSAEPQPSRKMVEVINYCKERDWILFWDVMLSPPTM
jgi:hypothetical protein